MNRRGFLAAGGTLLASVPVLGRIFKGKARGGRTLSSLDQSEVMFSSGPDHAHGRITFRVSDSADNVLEFGPGGEFRYRGHLIETDVELYEAFRCFLRPHIKQITGR